MLHKDRKERMPRGGLSIQVPAGRKTFVSEGRRITCLFDYDGMEKDVQSKVGVLINRTATTCSSNAIIYALHAWQEEADKTCCVFLKINNNECCIYTNTLEGNITRLGYGRWRTVDDFLLLNRDEFFYSVFTVPTEETEAAVWTALKQIFPENKSKTVSRRVLFETFIPYSFISIVGAEEYSNAGVHYQMLMPLPSIDQNLREIQEWKVTDRGQANESRKLQHVYSTSCYPKTREDFEKRALHWSSVNAKKILDSIPHRTILIDPVDSQNCGAIGFEGKYRSLHIYPSKTDTTYIVLKVYSVYNGHPAEGGRMEGYTFSKTMEIPAEQYQWTDEELTDRYAPFFGTKA